MRLDALRKVFWVKKEENDNLQVFRYYAAISKKVEGISTHWASPIWAQKIPELHNRRQKRQFNLS